jgi:hypothetical protein
MMFRIFRFSSRIYEKLDQKVLSIGFFLVLLMIGILNFRKYGIYWDAAAYRLNGGGAAIYIADLFKMDIVPEQYRQFPGMMENGMADHGVAYDLPLVVLEFLFGISEPMHIYQMRTFVNFLVFVMGTLSIFFIVRRRLASVNLALLASIFFVTSPRIFAAGFFSPSDMVFLSFFVLGVNFCIRFLENPTWKNALWAGLICGYSTDIRLLGIIIFPIVIFLFFVQRIWDTDQPILKIKPLIYFCLSGMASIYLFFPYLWASPFSRFIEVFQSLSRYNWGGENLYFGEFIRASSVPWHYIPVWIAITTPVVFLILFFLGLYAVMKSFALQRERQFERIQDLLFLGLFFGPIAMVIILDSTLYDSWRHLYFVYPFLVIIATIGWASIRSDRNRFRFISPVKVTATIVALAQLSIWMISNNPNQNLYFNFLAGRENLQSRWDMDFSGLSNKQALDYIFSRESKNSITVSVVSFTPFEVSLKAFPEDFEDRIKVVELEKLPDYIINNYRLVKEPFTGLDDYELVKKFTIDNSSYLEIWKKS